MLYVLDFLAPTVIVIGALLALPLAYSSDFE